MLCSWDHPKKPARGVSADWPPRPRRTRQIAPGSACADLVTGLFPEHRASRVGRENKAVWTAPEVDPGDLQCRCRSRLGITSCAQLASLLTCSHARGPETGGGAGRGPPGAGKNRPISGWRTASRVPSSGAGCTPPGALHTDRILVGAPPRRCRRDEHRRNRSVLRATRPSLGRAGRDQAGAVIGLLTSGFPISNPYRPAGTGRASCWALARLAGPERWEVRAAAVGPGHQPRKPPTSSRRRASPQPTVCFGSARKPAWPKTGPRRGRPVGDARGDRYFLTILHGPTPCRSVYSHTSATSRPVAKIGWTVDYPLSARSVSGCAPGVRLADAVTTHSHRRPPVQPGRAGMRRGGCASPTDSWVEENTGTVGFLDGRHRRAGRALTAAALARRHPRPCNTKNKPADRGHHEPAGGSTPPTRRTRPARPGRRDRCPVGVGRQHPRGRRFWCGRRLCVGSWPLPGQPRVPGQPEAYASSTPRRRSP